MRAQTIAEKAQIFFFSGATSSVVQVVKIANVDDIDVFKTIEQHISNATRASSLTANKTEKINIVQPSEAELQTYCRME